MLSKRHCNYHNLCQPSWPPGHLLNQKNPLPVNLRPLARIAGERHAVRKVHIVRSRSQSTCQSPLKSSISSYTRLQRPSVKLVPAKSVHRREGAFPPSKIISPTSKQVSQTSRLINEDEESSSSRPVVVIEQDETEDEKESPRRPGLELRREGSWVSLSQEVKSRDSSPNGQAGGLPVLSVSRSPSSVSSSSSISHLPSLPPKSIRHGGHGGSDDDEKPGSSLAPSAFKGLTNLKRFSSLPRTPSRSSKSSKRSNSPDARRSMSPPLPPVYVESPPRRRIIPKPKYSHPWPPAMNPADVVVLRGARERARAYAMKINELSMYDCGLREWMATQSRGPGMSLSI